MLFWKQRIPTYSRPEYLLLDRFRFVKYKDDSEIFKHYTPLQINYALKLDFANLGTITTVPIAYQ